MGSAPLLPLSFGLWPHRQLELAPVAALRRHGRHAVVRRLNGTERRPERDAPCRSVTRGCAAHAAPATYIPLVLLVAIFPDLPFVVFSVLVP